MLIDATERALHLGSEATTDEVMDVVAGELRHYRFASAGGIAQMLTAIGYRGATEHVVWSTLYALASEGRVERIEPAAGARQSTWRYIA